MYYWISTCDLYLGGTIDAIVSLYRSFGAPSSHLPCAWNTTQWRQRFSPQKEHWETFQWYNDTVIFSQSTKTAGSSLVTSFIGQISEAVGPIYFEMIYWIRALFAKYWNCIFERFYLVLFEPHHMWVYGSMPRKKLQNHQLPQRFWWIRLHGLAQISRPLC